jgi:hypothetical protein
MAARGTTEWKESIIPLIFRMTEADMTKEGKLVSGTGYRIENLFGKPVFLAGIFNSTGTGLDILHYLPEE